jgi:hypothetical protein
MLIQNEPNQMAAVWVDGSFLCVIEPTHNALPTLTDALQDKYPNAIEVIVYGRDFKAECEKIGIIAKVVYQYQSEAIEIELTWITNRSNRFPNGFDSWQETHCEICFAIGIEANKEDSSGVVEDVREADGMGGLWELAKDLTDAFEKANEGRQWDGEWIDEIDAYIQSKLK